MSKEAWFDSILDIIYDYLDILDIVRDKEDGKIRDEKDIDNKTSK